MLVARAGAGADDKAADVAVILDDKGKAKRIKDEKALKVSSIFSSSSFPSSAQSLRMKDIPPPLRHTSLRHPIPT